MDDWMPEQEAWELLGGLFPLGLGGADVKETLCPGGWQLSPLRLAFHPSPERRYEEAVRSRENLERLTELFKGRKSRPTPNTRPAPEPPPLEPLPDRETFLALARAEDETASESDEQELARLVGLCLWDVLSDNHDLILPDGRLRHLGSFRATAGIIADFFDSPSQATTEDSDPDWGFGGMGYCDFYMGTWAISGRTDLGPVYRLIFERLKALDFAWQYAFPRIGLVRFEKPESADAAPEWEGYDPSEALAEKEEQVQKKAEFEKLQADLESAHREALEAAKNRPVPPIVQAHQAIFGHAPAGWPPWEG